DGLFKDLYISGMDDLGNFTSDSKNSIRAQKTGGRYVIDGCFLDYNQQSFVRMNADNQKLYIKDSIFRNCGELLDPGDSKMIDTRGRHQDTIFVQNSTFYSGTGRLIRSDRSPINYLEFDHLTTVQFGDRIETEKVVDAKITNSLFVDMQFEGRVLSPGDPSDTLLAEIIDLDSLEAPEIRAEEERHLTYSNNSFAFSPELLTYFNGIDTLHTPVVFNQVGQAMLDRFPNMVAENNISELPTFSDAPPIAPVVAYAQHRLETNRDNLNNPDMHQDRNGTGVFSDDPSTFGPAPDEFDFDYATSDASYSHAEGGFPLGDLNWFPAKKAEWVDFMTSVDSENEQALPTRFTLEQNYPNPFNPSTTIVYQLNTPATVKLTVYNVIGQKIRTLVKDQRQKAGDYSVQWDGRDDTGRMVASGLYMYRLESDKQVQTKKMLLLK
ncbi:MAG: T9SS type A sorting domain-containing protein, partial [bacterium]